MKHVNICRSELDLIKKKMDKEDTNLLVLKTGKSNFISLDEFDDREDVGE